MKDRKYNKRANTKKQDFLDFENMKYENLMFITKAK